MGNLGFTFNCRGDYYSLVPGYANALEPGKRPRSTLQSTLVMKDGRPAMVLGSPGGDDQCLRTMQTLLNIVDFGMNVQQAIEAPKMVHTQLPYVVLAAHDVPRRGMENRIPEPVRDALRKKGHKLKSAARGHWV